MAEPLAEHLADVESRASAAKRLFVFSDFDGTLVPIKPKPDECRLDPGLGRTLSELAAIDRVRVGIISGREIVDLRDRVGVGGIAYAGNHGLEIQGPGFADFREPAAAGRVAELDRLIDEISGALAEIPHAWVQHKGLSATVHYRQVAAEHVPAVVETVERLTVRAREAGSFVLRGGKAVVEIRPAVDWHKGRAVDWLVELMSPGDADPPLIFLGDDETDEDVFRSRPGQMTISVGEGRTTAANYWLRDSGEVAEFMARLRGVLAAN